MAFFVLFCLLKMRGKVNAFDTDTPPLIYVSPNTIKTCLTPTYFLFGRQLFLTSNTTSTVAANLTVLSSTTDKINRMIKTKYKKRET